MARETPREQIEQLAGDSGREEFGSHDLIGPWASVWL
jgi:hypothetical protein